MQLPNRPVDKVHDVHTAHEHYLSVAESAIGVAERVKHLAVNGPFPRESMGLTLVLNVSNA